MSNIRVEILGPSVLKSGNSLAGKRYAFKKQVCYFHFDGAPYPEKGVIQSDESTPDYAPGLYDVLPSSFYVDRWGSLSVSPRLAPVKA